MFLNSRLPLAVSSFETLRNDKLIYIDKTEFIAKMLDTYRSVLLVRPRRFGKSLLVSTLASLFEHGLRDFKGLAIEKTWEEKTYPVVKLDFSSVSDASNITNFQAHFNRLLHDAFATIGFACDLSKEDDFFAALREFMRVRQTEGTQFVLLIDEYDAPLTHNLNDEEFFKSIRLYLNRFFSMLKSYQGALRFLFITGITKYRQVSIFSSLNNLTDISLDPQFGELLGYTQKEIEASFSEFLENAVQCLNEKSGIKYTLESLLDEMVANYDGFSFDEQAGTHVFAPWSVLNFLAAPQNGFKNYWIGSGGVSTWLVQWIKSHGMIKPDRFDQPVNVLLSMFAAATSPSEIPPEILLYQTGYLTIHSSTARSITLGYPNQEVANSLAEIFLMQFTSERTVASLPDITPIFREGKVYEVVEGINRLLLAIPYDGAPITNEAAVRGVVLAYILGTGRVMVETERHNAQGRSDIEISANGTHWVFEFKYVEKDAEARKALVEAIDQIRGKHYGETTAAKKLIRLGMVYSSESRKIAAWQEA